VVARPRPLTPHELKEHWLNRALERAGIERSRWRPAEGVEANRAAIEAVYRYYGALCVEHPELEWAGMASLIGPALYAGFMDVALLRLTGGDVFYETSFLTMQKKIFEDQATMHEAFLAGGADAIAELHASHIVDSATLEAWRQIAAGRVEAGNRTLLLREQRDIIDRFYVRMLARRQPAGSVFTYLMTLTGAPSVPGGKGYPERYPLTLGLGRLRLRTPLANGNIAIFANRWQLIEDDTLPAYRVFVRDHPAEARELMGTSVARRALPFRVLARAGLILRAAVTRWGIVEERPVKPLSAARTGATTIDLTRAPVQHPADYVGGHKHPADYVGGHKHPADYVGGHKRVWMNPGRRPFDLRVLLPDGREFHARPEFAVVLGDRLTVQLGEADLAGTAAALEAYAAEWGVSRAEIADWRRGAEQRPASDREHSTHVFPASAGVEFEVSHHVREHTFTLAAHFSAPAR
jgi:hypothetical protein